LAVFGKPVIPRVAVWADNDQIGSRVVAAIPIDVMDLEDFRVDAPSAALARRNGSFDAPVGPDLICRLDERAASSAKTLTRATRDEGGAAAGAIDRRANDTPGLAGARPGAVRAVGVAGNASKLDATTAAVHQYAWKVDALWHGGENITVPLNKKGRKILSSMKDQYGAKKGEQVFYASQNKGNITGVEKKKKK
jgi:hypothetical protein